MRIGIHHNQRDTTLHAVRFALTRVAQEMDRAKAEGRKFDSDNVLDAQLSIVPENGHDTLKIDFPTEIIDDDPDAWLGMGFGGRGL